MHKEPEPNFKSNSLFVAIRVRPLSESEQQKGVDKAVHVLDSSVLVLFDREVARVNSEWTKQRGKDKHYEFDLVLNENSSQTEVFTHTCQDLITGVIQGYNSSIFAYGPTGSGKSFTMLGTAQHPGLAYKTMASIYKEIESLSKNQEFKVSVGFLEIYNENIRDLLNPYRDGLDIREDPQKGVMVAGLSESIVVSVEDVERVIEIGMKKRVTEATNANQVSSRSHAILQIVVESREKVQGESYDIVMGKLNLIDLAGSERASKTKNQGARLLEGANINRSLLALGNCINALSEIYTKERRVFVPYRDSKLTRLLKDSLGGNCRTVMITCISPAFYNYEDTFNTLIYATRAKNIRTKVKKNTLNVKEHISKYSDIINKLKKEVKTLKAQLNNPQAVSPKLDNFLLLISEHFKEEANTRKTIYLTQQKIANLGFSLFNLQTKLQDPATNTLDSKLSKSIDADIQKLKQSIETLQDSEQSFRQKLEKLVLHREEMKESWTRAGVDHSALAQLQLELKKNLLIMNSLDVEGIETFNKLAIEQKDMYIRFLEDQIKLRDQIMHKTPKDIDEKTLKSYKSYEHISSYVFPSQNLCYSPSKEKSFRVLPEVKQSSIPRIDISPRKGRGNIFKSGERVEGYSQKYANRNRAASFESLGSAASTNQTNLTLSGMKIRAPTVVEKYSRSPYVRNWKNGFTPKSKN